MSTALMHIIPKLHTLNDRGIGRLPLKLVTLMLIDKWELISRQGFGIGSTWH